MLLLHVYVVVGLLVTSSEQLSPPKMNVMQRIAPTARIQTESNVLSPLMASEYSDPNLMGPSDYGTISQLMGGAESAEHLAVPSIGTTQPGLECTMNDEERCAICLGDELDTESGRFPLGGKCSIDSVYPTCEHSNCRAIFSACSHSFCNICITKWQDNGKSFCPVCRAKKGCQVEPPKNALAVMVDLCLCFWYMQYLGMRYCCSCCGRFDDFLDIR